MRRRFLVQDYYVKRVGARYDVVFEDTGFGPDAVDIFDVDSLLTMVEKARLIM